MSSKRARIAGIKAQKSSARTKKSFRETRRINKSGMLNGRPRVHDRKKLKREICQRVSEGELVTDVLKDLGITFFMISSMEDEDEQFAKDYARARILQTRAFASKAVKIGDGMDAVSRQNRKAIRQAKKELKKTDPRNWRQRIKTFESNLIQRNRLQLDALKWYTRVTNPREFGEKVDVTSDNKALPSAPQTLTVKFEGVKE